MSDIQVPPGFSKLTREGKEPKEMESDPLPQVKTPRPKGLMNVVAPESDLQLMVALTQVLVYFRMSRKEKGIDENLVLQEEEAALEWFRAKSSMDQLS